MFKNGREPVFITALTGVFGSIAIVLNAKNPYLAIGVFVLCLLFVYLLINMSMKNIRRISRDPSSHPVFYTIEHCISKNLAQIPISGRKKDLVVLYLKTKMEIMKDILLNTIEKKTLSSLPSDLLHINEKVRTKIKSEVPDMFFEKVSEWDMKNNSWTIEPLQYIIDSEYYCDTVIKYIACFDCVQVMVRGTIVAVENTIKSFNGDLDDYLNRGKNV